MASIERVVKDTSTSSERRISRVETDPHGFLANVSVGVANSISRLAVAPRAPYDVRSHERKTKRERKRVRKREEEKHVGRPRGNMKTYIRIRFARCGPRPDEARTRRGKARQGEAKGVRNPLREFVTVAFGRR